MLGCIRRKACRVIFLMSVRSSCRKCRMRLGCNGSICVRKLSFAWWLLHGVSHSGPTTYMLWHFIRSRLLESVWTRSCIQPSTSPLGLQAKDHSVRISIGILACSCDLRCYTLITTTSTCMTSCRGCWRYSCKRRQWRKMEYGLALCAVNYIGVHDCAKCYSYYRLAIAYNLANS